MTTNPFFPASKPQSESQEVSKARLTCKVCNDPCMREEYWPHDWVHEGEEVTISGIRISSNYDHKPEFDIIDV